MQAPLAQILLRPGFGESAHAFEIPGASRGRGPFGPYSARKAPCFNSISLIAVLERYTRQLFVLALFFAKLRWLNYLLLRSITLPFSLFSMIYTDARKLKIRRPQGRGGSSPPPGTINSYR